MNKLITGLAASMFVLAAHAQTPTSPTQPAAPATTAHAKAAPHKHMADKPARYKKHAGHQKPAVAAKEKAAT